MNVIKLLRIIHKEFPNRLPFLVALIVLSGLLESIGIGIIIPIVEYFYSAHSGQESLSQLTQVVFHFFSFLHIEVSLTSLLGLTILIFSFKSMVKYTEIIFTKKLTTHFIERNANKLFSKILRTKWSLLAEKKPGKYLNLITTENDNFEEAVQYTLFIISEGFLIAFYLTLAAIVSWKLTLLVGTSLFISTFFLKKLIRFSRSLANELTHHNESFHSFLSEILNSLKWIKASGNLETSTKKVNTVIKEKTTAIYNVGKSKAVLPSFFICFSIISITVITYLSLIVFNISYPSMLLILTIFYRTFPKFQFINQFYQQLMLKLPAVDIIYSSLKELDENQEHQGKQIFKRLEKGISFNNVSYSHNNETPHLNDISFTINKNDFMAIIGSSGSGKTTLIDTLLGLYEPDSGTICFDNNNITDYTLESIRKKIGVVSQDIQLFNDTIKNNILWGNDNIDDKQLNAILKESHVDEFLAMLPEGLETPIGNKGIKLSGGQRQRIAFARALINDPEILILDEATSALDAKSESIIQNTIESYKNKKTIILISHRLASIKQATTIFVLEKGKIAESGNWESLKAKDGLFEKFRKLQILE